MFKTSRSNNVGFGHEDSAGGGKLNLIVALVYDHPWLCHKYTSLYTPSFRVCFIQY